MQYLMQIFMPSDPQAWEALSEHEQQAITDEYLALRNEPGFLAGAALHPADTATTVRVEDGRTLTTDGPFVEVKEAIGGFMFLEADDLDAAIELAAKVPAARLGGAVEVRPVVER
jgi:hypothetical protein